MNWLRRIFNKETPSRESSVGKQRRLGGARRFLYHVVQPGGGTAANQVDVETSSAITILPPTPVKPAPVKLPLKTTAAEREILARAKAAILHARQAIDRKRTRLRQELARALAKLCTLRFLVDQAADQLGDLVKKQAEFLERVPAAKRRFLATGNAWTLRLVPWTLWVADTLIIARAWGIFGAVALPFLPHSQNVAALTMLLRAGLVSFGLIFGVRLAGGRMRETLDQLRSNHSRAGHIFDIGVVMAVVAGAIGLAFATSELQAALIKIIGGSSNVSVPTGILLSIVIFLLTVSFVCGFFLNEPEPKEARLHVKRIRKARKQFRSAVTAENIQRGAVRSIREALRGVDRQEQLLIAEQEAHTDQEINILKAENGHLYGFEFGPEDGAGDA